MKKWGMGRPGRLGVLDEPQLPGCRREVTQRGLAAVGRRSPRRCQGNGSSAGRGPARLGLARLHLGLARLHSQPAGARARARARGLAGLISAAQPEMGLRSGVRRRRVPGAIPTARV